MSAIIFSLKSFFSNCSSYSFKVRQIVLLTIFSGGCCKDCGGIATLRSLFNVGQICEHNANKSKCEICKSLTLKSFKDRRKNCEHNNIKIKCKKCKNIKIIIDMINSTKD